MGRLFDFLKTKEQRKEEDLKRILGLEGYEELLKTKKDFRWTRLHITKPIKQSDLTRLFKWYPEFDYLIFEGIDISGLNLSVIPYQERGNRTITFKKTKAGKKTFQNLPQLSNGNFTFEGIDFSGSPVVLPNPETVTLKIIDCTNLSEIRNLGLVGVELDIENSDVSGINFSFPYLRKHLFISNIRTQEEITSLEQLRFHCPNLNSLSISECPKLTKFGKVETLNALEILRCRTTGLTELDDFWHIFRNVNRVFLDDNKELADISALARGYIPYIQDINLSGCTSLAENMVPTIKKLRENGIKVDVTKTPLERNQELLRVTRTNVRRMHTRVTRGKEERE